MSSSDVAVWQDLLVAEREVARCRAALHGLPGRHDVLRQALLSPSPAGRQAALDYLQGFPGEVPGLLKEVVDLSVSLGWAKNTRDVLWTARRDVDATRLADVAASLLSEAEADEDDAINLSWLVLEIAGPHALVRLVESLSTNHDSGTRGLAATIRDTHEQSLGSASGGE